MPFASSTLWALLRTTSPGKLGDMLSRPSRSMLPRRAPRLSARERVLAQFRNVDLSAEERARATSFKGAGQVLPVVLGQLRLEEKRSQAEIGRVWNHLIDPRIVAHAQPVGIRNGTLFVHVDNSAWLYEIVRYRREEILSRLQHCFGREVIKKISFRVG